MTSILGSKYVDPDLRRIELSKFEIRREKEEYHQEQLDIEEEESDKFTSLVESIRSLGVIQPLYIIEHKDKGYEVIDGGRRLRAAQFLGLPNVPAMVFQGDTDESEIRKRALIANIQRKDLSQEEKGEGLVQYYKSGGVNPEHVISYLNTLRQRKQIKDKNQRENEFGPANISTSTATNSRGRPNLKEIEDHEEYAKFLDLHKKLGIPRMTQYDWMIQVVYIAPEIRKSPEYKSLSRDEKRYTTASEIRNKPEVQKKMVNDLASINTEYEEAKQRAKKEKLDTSMIEFRHKEKKAAKARMYLPNTLDKKAKEPINPVKYYGQLNGHLSRLWSALTMSKAMPKNTDDVLNDFLKPSRKEFKEIVNDLGGGERIQLDEWLSYVSQAIEDRRKLINTP